MAEEDWLPPSLKCHCCAVLCGAPLQYDAANRARREAEERDNRWLAQLSRPARVSFRWARV